MSILCVLMCCGCFCVYLCLVGIVIVIVVLEMLRFVKSSDVVECAR